MDTLKKYYSDRNNRDDKFNCFTTLIMKQFCLPWLVKRIGIDESTQSFIDSVRKGSDGEWRLQVSRHIAILPLNESKNRPFELQVEFRGDLVLVRVSSLKEESLQKLLDAVSAFPLELKANFSSLNSKNKSLAIVVPMSVDLLSDESESKHFSWITDYLDDIFELTALAHFNQPN